MAWSALLLFPTYLFFTIAISLSSLRSAAATNSNYAVTIAQRGAEQARLYHEANKSWPTDFGDVFGGELTQGVPYRISTITYPDGSYGIVVTREMNSMADGLDGKAVEMWTTDGGESWHCGPAYATPMPKESLPANCQEDSPAIP